MLDTKALEEAAHCLRTLAHPARLRMIQLLLQGEHTVGSLARACGISSHAASQHLGRMRDRGLLDAERRGREIYYHIEEEALAGILTCVARRYGRPRGSRRRAQ